MEPMPSVGPDGMIQTTSPQTRTAPALPGRNEACLCGSGKKYKHCCLAQAAAPVLSAHSVFALIEEARRNLVAERFGRASELLQLALRFDANNADALHFLGLVAHRQGDLPTALSLLERSILAAPNNATYFANLGLVLKDSCDLQRAIPLLRHSIQLDPTQYDAHFNLGTVLAQIGQAQEAMGSLVEAIRLRPQSAEAINTLGVCIMRQGSHERAIVCYRKAIVLDPMFAPAHSNLGRSLMSMGQLQDAAQSLECALVLDPNFADAMVNLGAVLNRIGRFEEAKKISKRALVLQPANLEAIINLGNAFKENGELRPAIAVYEEAIRLHPNEPRAYSNLGDTLRDLANIAQAARMYRKALEVCPSFTIAYSNLLYLHAFARDVTPEEELAVARGWEESALSIEERQKAREASSPRGGVFVPSPLTSRKLRIGIVSAEIGTHAVAEFLQPLMETLDRGRFHLTLFSTVHRCDARAEHLRSLCDDVVSLKGLPDAAATELIRQHGIDVLMDTSGHTASNRLGVFARRAAPVQCTYIGYWSTTGLTEMDWFISDPHAPAAVQTGFSEGLWRLPRIAVSYRGDRALNHTAWRPDPTGKIRLGSFNKFGKMREDTFVLWAKVLHALPEANLLLEDRCAADEESHSRVLSGLAAHGVAGDRVEFIPYAPGHERHMSLYNRLDIALDTVPFNSGTTAFDALWMGVPLVALEGSTVGGRMGASILSSLGRPEWIARTRDEYAAIVCSLARNVELRRHLRATQRDGMAASDLCDAQGLARALQEAFAAMYERWLAS